MILPDVNVLVYAHRSDERVHATYRDWLEELVNGPEPFGLSVLVAVAFVRIVTNKKIFPEPTPISTALSVIETLAEHPSARIVGPGEGHLELVARLCRGATATGKLVADAQHAAVAIEHGCTWVSRDADFSRFSPHGLRFQQLEPR